MRYDEDKNKHSQSQCNSLPEMAADPELRSLLRVYHPHPPSSLEDRVMSSYCQEINQPHLQFTRSLNWIWRFVVITILGMGILYAAVRFTTFLRTSNSKRPSETSFSQGQTSQIPQPPSRSNALIPNSGEQKTDTALLQSGNPELPPQSALPTQESEPVVLEVLGATSVVQPPSGFPTNQILRQQRYLLRNLSSQDILFYAVAYLNERGGLVAETSRASYPPDQSPVLGAGANETITRRYIDNTGASKVLAQIDSVVFADGSSYGPDRLKRKAAYTATVETRYLEAQHTLELLETQGPEAVREYLMWRLSVKRPSRGDVVGPEGR